MHKNLYSFRCTFGSFYNCFYTPKGVLFNHQRNSKQDNQTGGKAMELFVTDRNESFIDPVETIEAGKKLIKEFEAGDKADGIYIKDFYDIVNENHESIL
jgi:hypothetical protein